MMEEEYSREKNLELLDLAREAFRKSIGHREGEPIQFNHRDYSTLDMAFLWWFKKLVEDKEREACAKVCEKRETSYQYATDPWALEHIMEAQYCATDIRARGKE